MHPPRNPHVFVNKPLESGIYSPIKKIFLFLYGRRSNIILSLGGLILLLIPLKIFFNILDLMVYFPLVSSIYASLFTAVSLLCRGKELPSLLGFINIITFVFFIAVCIQQLNVQDLACFFLSFMASSELLFFNSDYSYKAGNRSVLLMDNMQPGSGSQPEAQSKGTTYNPTSQNPSLNITSDSDKVRVEGIYNSEEVKYTDKRSILNSSFYTFTRYWEKTINDLSNPSLSNETLQERIDEAKKKCDVMERRLHSAIEARKKASEANASLEAWHLRHNYDLTYYNNSRISYEKVDNLIVKAEKELADFRGSD